MASRVAEVTIATVAGSIIGYRRVDACAVAGIAEIGGAFVGVIAVDRD